jgi:phosphopantothenoylcysteine decarboxylase / phosphopantothenate---cysteine ligase
MSILKGKKILLGITGSIAAYKIPMLIRLIVKAEAEVKVVVSKGAEQFVTKEVLAVLSNKEVVSGFYSADGLWESHVHWGLWADLYLIAPASANTLSKLANGLCDNQLTAIYLSARCPVMVSPAMDLDMFKNFAVQNNISTLAKNGVQIIQPENGPLASGLVGEGRMPEPESLFQIIQSYFESHAPLKNKTVLITSGATIEHIDPVRYITNHSTGKMGAAIAEVAAGMGAKVIYVHGLHAIKTQHTHIQNIEVQSAAQMYEAVHAHFKQVDIAIMAAAVADYKPKLEAKEKIKKKADDMQIDLVKTQDILFSLGQIKQAHQILVGFALETENQLENAKSKLQNKKADIIVLNTTKIKGAAFGHDTNQITLLDRNNKITEFELKSKQEVAEDIINYIISHFLK